MPLQRRRREEAKADASVGWSMPAPINGWNARDALAQMSPKDAIQLDNWFPGTTSVDVRKGRLLNATIPASPLHIETLMGLAKADGTFKRFAAAEDGIYDITAGGAIAVADSAATTGRWESTQINVGGIAYLWCCAGDGVNKSRVYKSDTSTWIPLDGASVPVLTGITSEDVTNVSLWKYRLILCEKNSLKFWYGPLNSVGGIFNSFDLGQVFMKGGYLVATANWSMDGGDGSDDRFVAISSEGEVVIYQGTDPSAAATFALVGRFNIGKPIGKRCFLPMAGDLGVLTEQGLWPLSKALANSQASTVGALTDRIQAAFNAYHNDFGAQFGWQAVLLPKGPAVLVNVPFGGHRSYQFVMNSITGAWCRFTGWYADAMLVLDGKLYIASNHSVYEAWTGEADDAAAITAGAVCAYHYGPTKGRAKKVTLVRPVMAGTAQVTVSLALDADFETRKALSTLASNVGVATLYDSAIWDEAVWNGSNTMVNKWRQVPCRPGRAFSLRCKVQTKNIKLSWSSVDFIGEPAGLM